MKKRSKKYVPKGMTNNPLAIFGGMLGTHRAHLQELQVKNHKALSEIVQGRGNKDHFDMITGAINMANVMCEMGIGDEYRQVTLAARDAMLAMGKRAMANEFRFVFKGDELKAVNEMLEIHNAQLENIRAVDVDRASNEVIRRIKHHINSTSVKREFAKEAA